MTPRSLLCCGLLSLGLWSALCPPPLYAEDEEAASSDEGEFETGWIGLRVGAWYRPNINMDAQVTGRGFTSSLANVIGTELDIKRDLGVHESPYSETSIDFDAEAVIEFSPYIETRWVSVYGSLVAPFEYRGKRILSRDLSFGGATFTASTTVRSKFSQFFMGTDVAINIFNNRWFRVSPMISARAIGIDWEVKSDPLAGQVLKGDTKDIKSPLQLGDFQILPYPELGAILSVGYRDYVEVSLIMAASYISYLEMEGSTYRFEFNVRAYPIPWVGLELGVRYLEYDISSRAEQTRRGAFDLDLEFVGLTAAITVRL